MSRQQRDIDPTLIEMDVEERYIQSNSNKSRRIKLERGQSAQLRFLPARLGPKGLWYARIAKHWVNQRAIICPRHTSPDYGGDPEAYCDACDTAKELNEHGDKAISTFGYKSMAQSQWLTYCLMFRKSTGQGPVDLPAEEQLNPYEFNHYKSTYDELKNFFRNNYRQETNPKSVLDYIKGCDFWANKGVKGIRLDRQDPQPIFDDLTEANVATHPDIVKIEEAMKTPKVTIPTDAEVKLFANKMWEAGIKAVTTRERSQPSRSDGGRAGYAEHDDDQAQGEADQEPMQDPEDAPPPPRGRSTSRTVSVPARTTAAPAARRSTPPVRTTTPAPMARTAAPSVAEDDQIPGAEVPNEEPSAEENEQPVEGEEAAPELAEEAPAPIRRSAPAPVARTAAPTRATATAAAPSRLATAATTKAPTRPAAPTNGAAPTRAPARQAPAPLSARTAAPAPAVSNEKIDDEETLPEEATDQAPAADEPLPAEGGAEVEEVPPPAVTRAGSGALGANIAKSIANVTKRTTAVR